MKSFKLLLPAGASGGRLITEKTIVNGSPIKGDLDRLRKLVKAAWCKENNVKSFKQWADELNEDENFEGTFTPDDALDNLSSTFTLNIDGKHVNLYDWMKPKVAI